MTQSLPGVESASNVMESQVDFHHFNKKRAVEQILGREKGGLKSFLLPL